MSQRSTTGEMLIRMASHALVTGATLPLGPPGAAIAAVGTVIFDAAMEADKRVWARFNAMAEEALVSTGMSLDELRAWATRDDAHLTFIRDLVATALTSLDEQKAQALQRILAVNLRDEAKVDDSILVLRAIRDLEAPHIRVASDMLRTKPDGTEITGKRILGVLRWSPEDINHRHPEIGSRLLFNIIATLEGHGLITKVPSVGMRADGSPFVGRTDSYVPTGFAVTCVNYLTLGPGG